MLRESLGGGNLLGVELLARVYHGQSLCLGSSVVVGRLSVDVQEAVEDGNLASCHEVLFVVADGNVGCGLFHLRVGHLRGDGALPDELVEALLCLCAVDGAVLHICGADSLVSLLRTLGICSVLACLAWRIPGTGEPGELPSMGSHRVGHD